VTATLCSVTTGGTTTGGGTVVEVDSFPPPQAVNTPVNTAIQMPDFQLIFMMQALKFFHVRVSLGAAQTADAVV
jgi:hypothetical protein